MPVIAFATREDDLHHDFFRPYGVHNLVAALDETAGVTAWAHRLASASKYYRRADVKPEDHWTAELYPDDFPAQLVPNLRLEWFGVQSGIARGSWRAPAHTANAFVVQSFVDEVAHAAKRDPLELRLALLGDRELDYAQHGGPTFDTGRLAQVTKLAAERIGWGRKLPEGRVDKSRIMECMTRYRLGERVGFGMAEYLDHQDPADGDAFEGIRAGR